jgi:hypothetical protein
MKVYPQYAGETDVVCIAYWKLTGQKNTATKDVVGSSRFSYTPGNPFTPYNQLTQDQVIGWVQAAFGQQQITKYEALIAQQLDSDSLPLPWAP